MRTREQFYFNQNEQEICASIRETIVEQFKPLQLPSEYTARLIDAALFAIEEEINKPDFRS